MMTKRIVLLFAAILMLSFAQAQQLQNPKYTDTSLDFETRALDLVMQMTLEEKISQLGNNSDAIPRLGINEYDWWNECLHGVARAGTATVFPQAIGMAATFNTKLIFDVANIISDEARAKHHEALRNNDFGRYKGLTYWSPNINIFRDPRWGRGHETYGEDPYLTGQMGIQFVRGLQGDDPKYLKLVATAKHFAVHNGPEPERHWFNAVPNARDLWETYLPAFHDLVVDAKAYSVMGAYNRVDGQSASASWLLLEDILRKEWGFDGYVVSDCGAIRDIYAYHKIVNSAEEAAAVGLRHGCDLNCGGVYKEAMLEAVNKGLIDEGEIDRALYRLMLARMKLGMFDPPEMVPYAQIPFSVNDSKDHDEYAYKMAQESMTLLKNDGILPLNKKKIKSLAILGPNAKSIDALRANYYGDASNPVTVFDGLQKALGPKVKIYYNEACQIVEHDEPTMRHQLVESKYLSSTDPNGNKIQGLRGEYFKGAALEGEPVLTQTDAVIRMFWRTGSPTETAVAQGILTPENALENDHFSVRWSGKLLSPGQGEYEFGAFFDDGCRIYIDDQLIINDWSENTFRQGITKFNFEEDKTYNIKIEYFEATQDAGIMLVWKKLEEEETKPKGPFEPSAEMLANVKKADVAIFVGGLDANWEGEEMRNRQGIDGFNGGDRTKIELPEVQVKTLKALVATGTPVIFVLMAGSAIAFDGLENEIPGILMAWYPGQRGGDAVADVLLGNYNPAGRLPVTFYTSTNELADFTDYNMQAGKGFTYRYYKGEPLYPFGHGLSYTKFEYSDLQIDKQTATPDENINISFKIKNNGNYNGDETIQLYVRDIESSKPMPVKQLRAFERISLAKGEEKTVSFILKPSVDFRYYNSMLRKYMVEPGQFEIQIGASSSDIRLRNTITVQ
ncbi:MAG: glycoside hydrolase family 3 C-terminal domain-containing protein [Prolixibacteraceae bacterium]|nr:glycoside hydrolase family 3 C-terminal domain-containing protein [Prolixibacteraceae bacterium]